MTNYLIHYTLNRLLKLLNVCKTYTCNAPFNMASWMRYYNSPELPKNYFRATVDALRYGGIELEGEESMKYKIFSKFIMFVLVYSYTCVEGYELYATWGDMNNMTTVLNYLVTHIIGAVKITHMYLYRDRFKELLKKMQEGLFKPDENRGGIEEGIAVRSVIKKTEIQLLIYYTMVGTIVVAGILESLKNCFTSPRDLWHLPYLNISLVDISTSPTYEVAYLYQTFCIAGVAVQIAASDVLRTSLMAHLSVQMVVLRHSLKNLKTRAVKLQEATGQAIEKCFDEVIADTVNHHLLIFDLAKETEALCSSVCLVIVLSTVMQLCFLLYQTSLVSINSVVFVLFFIYWVDIAYQTAQYCYWGNEVTLESLGVAQGAAEADWPYSPKGVGKSLILIIARAQKPFYITAGNFVPLSLAFFMSIVKGSFSYFMVLKQMNEAKGITTE